MSAVAQLDEVPEHLRGPVDLEKAKESIEKKPAEVVFDPTNPKSKPEYTFDFSWQDRRGRRFEGQFTSKILTVGETSKAGQLQASLSGPLSYDQLDPLTREVNFLLARLTFALIGKRPDWAKDLAGIQNLQLLQAIYQEVVAHENYFHGYTEASE